MFTQVLPYHRFDWPDNPTVARRERGWEGGSREANCMHGGVRLGTLVNGCWVGGVRVCSLEACRQATNKRLAESWSTTPTSPPPHHHHAEATLSCVRYIYGHWCSCRCRYPVRVRPFWCIWPSGPRSKAHLLPDVCVYVHACMHTTADTHSWTDVHIVSEQHSHGLVTPSRGETTKRRRLTASNYRHGTKQP